MKTFYAKIMLLKGWMTKLYNGYSVIIMVKTLWGDIKLFKRRASWNGLDRSSGLLG